MGSSVPLHSSAQNRRGERHATLAPVGRDHFLVSLVGASSERHQPQLAAAGRPLAIATSVEAAFDSDSRKRGLLGRDHLAPDTALIIAPCSAVHTFGMRFSIDVIFAARDGRVVKVRRAMPPGRISGRAGTFAVIEMAAGEVERHALRVGDYLEVRTTAG